MRVGIILALWLGGLSAGAESLRCTADISATYRFAFEARPFTTNGPISAVVTVPGLFGVSGRNTGKISFELIGLSRTGYADYEGFVSDFYRKYPATMWILRERQDDLGRFRGRITIQMDREVVLNLICRIKS